MLPQPVPDGARGKPRTKECATPAPVRKPVSAASTPVAAAAAAPCPAASIAVPAAAAAAANVGAPGAANGGNKLLPGLMNLLPALMARGECPRAQLGTDQSTTLLPDDEGMDANVLYRSQTGGTREAISFIKWLVWGATNSSQMELTNQPTNQRTHWPTAGIPITQNQATLTCHRSPLYSSLCTCACLETGMGLETLAVGE